LAGSATTGGDVAAKKACGSVTRPPSIHDCFEQAVAAAGREPGRAAVGGQRHRLVERRLQLSGRAAEGDAARVVDERRLGRALAREQEAARTVAAVGGDQQLVAQAAQALGQAGALGVAVAGVAGSHHGFARLLQQVVDVAQRTFGQREHVAAGVQRALVGVLAPDRGQRTLGTRRGRGVVARALDALAAGELLLRLQQLALALLQAVDAAVEGLSCGDAHGQGSSQRPAVSSKVSNTL
jgi:hypothetical protein